MTQLLASPYLEVFIPSLSANIYIDLVERQPYTQAYTLFETYRYTYDPSLDCKDTEFYCIAPTALRSISFVEVGQGFNQDVYYLDNECKGKSFAPVDLYEGNFYGFSISLGKSPTVLIGGV